jgi:hypothetical protein
VARQAFFEAHPRLNGCPFKLLFSGAIVCKLLLYCINAFAALYGEWHNQPRENSQCTCL